MKIIRKMLIFPILLFCNILGAQTVIPAIIAIDGTLPRQLSVTATVSGIDTLEFTYLRGAFRIENFCMNTLIELPDTAVIHLCLGYTVFHSDSKRDSQRNLYKTTYYFDISLWKYVLLSGDVLINITTFNKSKTNYYVDWSGNGVVKMIQYDKSMGNRRKALKRIKSIYDVQN